MGASNAKYGVVITREQLSYLRLLCEPEQTVGQLLRGVIWDYIGHNLPNEITLQHANVDFDDLRRRDTAHTESTEVYLT